MTKEQVLAWQKSRGFSQEGAAKFLGCTTRQYQNIVSGHSKVMDRYAVQITRDIESRKPQSSPEPSPAS